MFDNAGLEASVHAPMDAQEGSILQQDSISRDLFDLAPREADDEDPRIPGCKLERRVDEPDGVKDDVHPGPFVRAENLANLRDPSVGMLGEVGGGVGVAVGGGVVY